MLLKKTIWTPLIMNQTPPVQSTATATTPTACLEHSHIYTVIFWALPGGSRMWETRSAIYQGTGKAVSLFQAILNGKYITQILPQKVKLSQCLIKHHATISHRGVNPLFHTFLPWVTDGGVSGQLQPQPVYHPPLPTTQDPCSTTHSGPVSSCNALQKNLLPCWESNQKSSVSHATA